MKGQTTLWSLLAPEDKLYLYEDQFQDLKPNLNIHPQAH